MKNISLIEYLKPKYILFYLCLNISYSFAQPVTVPDIPENNSNLHIPGLYFGMTRFEFKSVIDKNNIPKGTWNSGSASENRQSPETIEIVYSFNSSVLGKPAKYKYGFTNDRLVYSYIMFEKQTDEIDNEPNKMCSSDFDFLKSNSIQLYGAAIEDNERYPEVIYRDHRLMEKDKFCDTGLCEPTGTNYVKTVMQKYEGNNYHLHLEKEFVSNSWKVTNNYTGVETPFQKKSCKIIYVLNYEPQPIEYSEWRARNLNHENSDARIPQDFSDSITNFTTPASLPNLESIQQCAENMDENSVNFTDCMANILLSDGVQKKAYECTRRFKDDDNKEKLGLCLLKSNMGGNERKAVDDAYSCYKKNGNDINQISLCFAGKNGDEKTARVAGCIQQQSNSSDFSYWQLATCYGAKELKMNAEASIAVECAMSSGGEPLTFIGCTGGRLTERELEKCFEKGVGGDGCFGKNNLIIQHYRKIGNKLNEVLGESNDIAKAWNNAVTDISEGAGTNNDLLKAAQKIRDAANNINSDLENGIGQNNDIVQTLNKAIPGFENLF